MTDTITHENLLQALIAAQSEIDHVINDSHSVYSGYASLSAVISTVKEPLNRNGIYFQQQTRDCESGVIIETIFMGYGEELSCGPVYIPADNRKAFAYGSAMTYARRYSLCQACGIASVDDDGMKAQENPPEALQMYELKSLDGKILRTNNCKTFLEKHQETAKTLTPEELEEYNELNRQALIDVHNWSANDEAISAAQRKKRIEYVQDQLGVE